MNKKPLKSLPSLSGTDKAKVERAKKSGESVKVDDFQLTIAEFGIYYGWDAVKDVLDNKIDGETMMWLLVSARKVAMRHRYFNAQTSMIGAVSANSKNVKKTFTKLTEDFIKKSKADL